MQLSRTYIYKLCIAFGIWTSMLLSNSLYSQQLELFANAENLIHSNPNEAIKIADHILNITEDTQEKALANLLLIRCYMVKGEYNKAVLYAFSETNLLEGVDIETRAEINTLKAEISRKLYLKNLSQEYLTNAESLIDELPNDRNRTQLEHHINLEYINSLLDQRKHKEALLSIKNAEVKFSELLEIDVSDRRDLFIAKERAYNELFKYDSAVVYVNRALALMDVPSQNNLFQKAQLYRDLGYLYLQQKAFKDSEEAYFIALRFTEIIENPILSKQINKDLAFNYLASNRKSQHKTYNDEYLVLERQVELIELESVNTLYNMLSSQDEAYLLEEKQIYRRFLYTLFAGVFLIVSIGIFILLKSEGRKKRLKEIINYLEISRDNFIKIKPTKKTSSRRVTFSEETEQAILLKLKRFESSKKFLNKDMSLAVLAGQFETNTKYLSGIINKHYNDNFNTFINKLRINYIMNKLKNEPSYINYKISYLASESGYSSHSSFATVFKSIVGMSPATFINLIREERSALEKIVAN